MAANKSIFGSKSVAALVCIAGLVSPASVDVTIGAITRAESQTQSANAPHYEFDVVSIKIEDPNDTGADSGVGWSANGLTANGIRMWWLLRVAYDMPKPQVVDAPKWFDDVRFRIEARLDPETAAQLQKLAPKELTAARQQMLRAVLAERFALSFHSDSRDLPAYFLTVAKDGPKLQEAKPGFVGKSDVPDIYGNRATDFVTMSFSGQYTLVGQAASMTTFTSFLSMWGLSIAGENARPILDKTGLTGRYDFTVKFSPENIFVAPPAPDAAGGQPVFATPIPTGPNLFKALQDGLGLKLQQGKGPIPVIVIDHAEKPSGN